jgi:hypothetical protein
MKFIISIILMAFLSFTACLFFPWWSISFACFVVALLIPQKHWAAFVTGFLALFLLWFGLSFWISFKNSHILALKVSQLILNTASPFYLVLLTASIGAVVGGFSSLTGSFLRAKSK